MDLRNTFANPAAESETNVTSPGTRVQPCACCAKTAFSRTPVFEALKVLQKPTAFSVTFVSENSQSRADSGFWGFWGFWGFLLFRGGVFKVFGVPSKNPYKNARSSTI